MKELVKGAARKLGFEITRTPSGQMSLDPFLVMRQLVPQDEPTIFDVGAHTGHTAVHFRSLFPNATIHCFEPFPDSFDRMSALLAGDSRIGKHPLALCDSAGAAMLNVNGSKATNSLLASEHEAARFWGANLLDTEAQVEVETQTVDGFCSRHDIGHIDILKLDVQGAEYSVLSGARGMLARQAIDIVYMEMITAPTYVGQRKLHEYLALFDSHDYKIFDFYNPVRSEGLLIQTDNIMISSSYLERFRSSRGK